MDGESSEGVRFHRTRHIFFYSRPHAAPHLQRAGARQLWLRFPPSGRFLRFMPISPPRCARWKTCQIHFTHPPGKEPMGSLWKEGWGLGEVTGDWLLSITIRWTCQVFFARHLLRGTSKLCLIKWLSMKGSSFYTPNSARRLTDQ